jgi:hypothetical protein
MDIVLLNEANDIRHSFQIWLDDNGDDSILDDLIVDKAIDELEKAFCAVLGCVPTQDHCGRPEHDFCMWCRKPTPGLATR